MKHSRGKIIIIVDCDSTYDFSDLRRFYQPLSDGICDVVIGNRLIKKMENQAMPISHLCGVFFLSALGRMRFNVEIRDFHSGLRSLTREAAERMEFRTSGMEFSTEMIALSAKNGLRIRQTPIILRKSKACRKSKLCPIRDGFRHLLYIFFC